MLRRSLMRALERKGGGGRPVMAKARGIPGRARPAVTTVAAGEPIYTGEELDLPRGMPREARAAPLRTRPLPPPPTAHARQAAAPPRRILPGRLAPSRLATHERTPASPAAAHRRLPSIIDTRDAADEAYDDAEEDLEEVDETQHASRVPRMHPREAYEAAEEESGDVEDEEEAEEAAHHAVSSAEAAVRAQVEAAGGAAPGTQQSKEAYKFLLDHIDAEIAALQRRQTAVTNRRQNLEERNSHRVKELFEFMESPWLLLSTEVAPALPATGVDVYLKEQRVKKGTPNHSSTTAAAAAAAESHDKMFVLACHKNYRSLPASEKRFYEEAAAFNAAVRQELKYRLASGCARFEAFCQQVKECTADMAREGRVPELPATWQHHGGHYGSSHNSRYQGLSKWQREARQAQAATATGDESAPAEEDTAEESGRGKTKKKAKASRRVRAAARGKKGGSSSETNHAEEDAEEEGDDDAEEEEEVVTIQALTATKRKGGKKTAPSPKAKPKPKTAKKNKAPAAKKAAPKASKKGKGKAAGSTAAAAATAAGHSASIPLPDLNKLAIKKIKKVAAAAAGKAGKKPKASKPTPKKGAKNSAKGKKK